MCDFFLFVSFHCILEGWFVVFGFFFNLQVSPWLFAAIMYLICVICREQIVNWFSILLPTHKGILRSIFMNEPALEVGSDFSFLLGFRIRTVCNNTSRHKNP